MASSVALTGISGYDFTGITEMLISNYSKPLNTMQEKISGLEVKKKAWQDLNTRLSALEGTLADLKKASTWTGTAATTSNTDILTATSDASALPGTYNITVSNLAVAQTAASEVQNVASSTSATGVSAGTFRITVGAKNADISVTAGASLQNIASSINNSKIGVNASVVKVDGGYQLALVSAKTGTENAAIFTDGAEGVLGSLGVVNPVGSADGIPDGTLNIVQSAENASIQVNGIDITSSSNTVTNAIDGMTLTLNEESPTNSVRVTVAEDYTKTEETVKKFVDQYNSVMTLIEKNLAYNEATGAKGALYADPSVQAIQSRLRKMVSSSMGFSTGTFKLLSDIGISTSKEDFGKSATLSFDTTEFLDALKDDTASVANLFGAPAGGVTPIAESTELVKAQGLANILGEYLDPYLEYGGVLDETEKSYSNQIQDMEDNMEEFQRKIDAYSERTSLKFANLESQLSALSSQSSYLSSIFSSLSTSSSNTKK